MQSVRVARSRDMLEGEDAHAHVHAAIAIDTTLSSLELVVRLPIRLLREISLESASVYIVYFESIPLCNEETRWIEEDRVLGASRCVGSRAAALISAVKLKRADLRSAVKSARGSIAQPSGRAPATELPLGGHRYVVTSSFALYFDNQLLASQDSRKNTRHRETAVHSDFIVGRKGQKRSPSHAHLYPNSWKNLCRANVVRAHMYVLIGQSLHCHVTLRTQDFLKSLDILHVEDASGRRAPACVFQSLKLDLSEVLSIGSRPYYHTDPVFRNSIRRLGAIPGQYDHFYLHSTPHPVSFDRRNSYICYYCTNTLDDRHIKTGFKARAPSGGTRRWNTVDLGNASQGWQWDSVTSVHADPFSGGISVASAQTQPPSRHQSQITTPASEAAIMESLIAYHPSRTILISPPTVLVNNSDRDFVMFNFGVREAQGRRTSSVCFDSAHGESSTVGAQAVFYHVGSFPNIGAWFTKVAENTHLSGREIGYLIFEISIRILDQASGGVAGGPETHHGFTTDNSDPRRLIPGTETEGELCVLFSGAWV
ncbi:hypothetical protein DFP72DRAFT_851519 [Ephemerocybe angulata]|uniref:Uncharacterized protein n=1 Tax=Ephemerocybe angulata TaxID=980116 RepID=A0A8H6HPA8_9AGAR|nr:hypothetical protein DFP72DRAFT_851519 [Tulosesus angulatus]